MHAFEADGSNVMKLKQQIRHITKVWATTCTVSNIHYPTKYLVPSLYTDRIGHDTVMHCKSHAKKYRTM